MPTNTDYVFILKALQDIPFACGRKLLFSYLQGDESNKSVKNNFLHRKDSFGALAYDESELHPLVDKLIQNNFVRVTSTAQNKFWKLLEITPKGVKEIDNPTLHLHAEQLKSIVGKTEITEEDQKRFSHFGDFLHTFNDEQKKAIISPASTILCVAGAGTGKTTVLTKRIQALVQYRSVPPTKILAITFTRKARTEMQHRLETLGIHGVFVETFNSWCEKLLQTHTRKIYDKSVYMASYNQKKQLIHKALQHLNISNAQAIDLYFTPAQKRSKLQDELITTFIHDCFHIRDHFKAMNESITPDQFEHAPDQKAMVDLVCSVCRYVESSMKRQGLRDYTDQLVDTVKLLTEHPDCVPKYEHILVDEYQDVNATQVTLIELCDAPHLFAVGDPRQSIFGWRGSDISFISSFAKTHPKCETITLTKNYRSTPAIVELCNYAIKEMGLPDLTGERNGSPSLAITQLESQDQEYAHIINLLQKAKTPLDEIFVLSRTNKELKELSSQLALKRIKHVVRADEVRTTTPTKKGAVTLATVHAIKGLEATAVIVMGANQLKYPIKASEHPIIDMLKLNTYDKEEEERRLFYVALSRAKQSVRITYTGTKPTYFVTPMMSKMLTTKKTQVSEKLYLKEGDVLTRLKAWRRAKSQSSGLPPYMVASDKTLIELTTQTPSSLEDLQQIHGLGPAKISKFGEELLDLLVGK